MNRIYTNGDTYVDAVRVRRVMIGLGSCNCDVLKIRFGELSRDDMVEAEQFHLESVLI